MRKDSIIIGTRGSKLALWQADYVAGCLSARYPDIKIEKKIMTTKGDRVLDAPLAKIGGKGLFTKELENDMLSGGIDIAVHSLKDMPTEVPDGLTVAAITKRADPGDALVSPRYRTFAALPKGARVGTSSLRRKAQLLNARPDLDVVSVRGNVQTRLQKWTTEKLDAVVLAVAGLKRLGLAGQITEIMPSSLCLPAVGQGALAIEARAGDSDVLGLVSFLNDEATALGAKAERSFLVRVEGGCQVPVGVYAEAAGAGGLRLQAVIASLDGSRLYRDEVTGAADEAERLGIALAEKLLAAGGLAIMHELGLLLEQKNAGNELPQNGG